MATERLSNSHIDTPLVSNHCVGTGIQEVRRQTQTLTHHHEPLLKGAFGERGDPTKLLSKAWVRGTRKDQYRMGTSLVFTET